MNLTVFSEYGEKWHEEGMKENKQNVFDDFKAAAEHVIHKNITKPSKLVFYCYILFVL